MPKDDNCKSDKRISKWLLVTILFAIVIALGGTIFFISQSTAVQEHIAQKRLDKMHFEWPDTYIASLLPIPQSNNGHIGHNSDNAFSVYVYNVTTDDYHDYCELCMNYGFHYLSNKNDFSYTAYDPTGNMLNISYDVNSAQMTIYISNRINENNGDFISVDVLGLTMNVKSVNPSGCIIEITQEGGNITGELITGSKYYLQELNENVAWIENTKIYYADFTAESYSINRDSVTGMNISWDYICGTLDNGHYRIVKEVLDFRKSGDYDTYFLFAEFDIDNTTASLPTKSSGNIGNLLYYGKSALHVDKGNNIIIQLATLDDYDSVKSVCVYNCQAKKEILLPVSGEVKYTAEDSGSYYIYAIMNDGKSLDLIEICGIEHAHTVD